jgi:hypothetical protein
VSKSKAKLTPFAQRLRFLFFLLRELLNVCRVLVNTPGAEGTDDFDDIDQCHNGIHPPLGATPVLVSPLALALDPMTSPSNSKSVKISPHQLERLRCVRFDQSTTDRAFGTPNIHMFAPRMSKDFVKLMNGIFVLFSFVSHHQPFNLDSNPNLICIRYCVVAVSIFRSL